MEMEEFIAKWEQHESPEELHLFLTQHLSQLSDENIQRMKARIWELADAQLTHAVMLAESLHYAAELSAQPLHMVAALIAQGNLAVRQGDNSRGIALYDEAQRIALEAGNELEAARSQIGKVWALLLQGKYEEAIKIGEAARLPLQTKAEFWALANLDANLGLSYQYLAEYEKAIEVWQSGLLTLSKVATLSSRSLTAMLKFNISSVLADQNRYQEALEIATEAAATQRELGNSVALAICQEKIGFYNLQLGHFNKALRLLDEARQVFELNKMQGYILACDFFTVPCYLALNRFERAVEVCQELLEQLLVDERNTTFEAAQFNQYLGVALTHLGRREEALYAFEQARQIFSNIGSATLVANPILEQAEFHYQCGDYAATETLCAQARSIFNAQGLTANSARCDILLSRIWLVQGQLEEAKQLAIQAMVAGQIAHMPLIVYQALLLQAEITEAQGDHSQALELYQASLFAVEEMRGRVAAEARAGFVEDKEAVYQGAVALSLAAENWSAALELVERNKSRGLVDLLAGELDVRVRVRAEADRELVGELENWRARRNGLVSRLANWSNSLVLNVRSTVTVEAPPDSERLLVMSQMKECEKQISNLVERLQVRNATYAEDAILRPPSARIATECLEEGTVLVEYYICRGEVLAFVLDSSKVSVVRHLSTAQEVNRLLSFLRLNLAGVTHALAEGLTPEQKAGRLNSANANARSLLQKLYRQLIAPLSAHLSGYQRLIIVPHGPLHYLPFHALYNSVSQRYLLEEWEEISYLPSGSLLHFCRQRSQRPAHEQGQGALVMGYSGGGQLAHCLHEARSVADLLGQAGDSNLYLEEEATETRFKAEAGSCRLLHLATHGEFRQDDPLFSALLLADGELTAQELFNYELKASLVTLSACETGLGTLGGGDELLGLSRACLYAGASSLLLSLWRVEDESVALLMNAFYTQLMQGERKASALRAAQLTLLRNSAYNHPFFWAPFILIGDPGLL